MLNDEQIKHYQSLKNFAQELQKNREYINSLKNIISLKEKFNPTVMDSNVTQLDISENSKPKIEVPDIKKNSKSFNELFENNIETLNNSMNEINNKQTITIEVFQKMVELLDYQNLNSQKQVEIMQIQFEDSQKQAIENAKENKINRFISIAVLVIAIIQLFL